MHRIIIHKPPDAIPELAERDIDHTQQADLKAAGELLHDLMLTDARTELALLHEPLLILASEHDRLTAAGDHRGESVTELRRLRGAADNDRTKQLSVRRHRRGRQGLRRGRW